MFPLVRKGCLRTHTLTHTREHFPPMTADDAASRRRRLRLPLDGAVGKLNITAAQKNRNDKTTHDKIHILKKI